MQQSFSKTITRIYPNVFIYVAIAMVVVIIAFYPSYFSQLDQNDVAHHVHGISALLWVVLLISQPLLYRVGNLSLHRKLGRLSYVLVPVMVISAVYMIKVMVLKRDEYPPLSVYQLAFIDVATIGFFLYFFVKAMQYRNRVHEHARYMICTLFGPMIPAITRLLFFIPTIDTISLSVNVSYVIMEGVVILLVLQDRKTKYNIYTIALAGLLIQHVLLNFIHEWYWWQGVMDAFAGR